MNGESLYLEALKQPAPERRAWIQENGSSKAAIQGALSLLEGWGEHDEEDFLEEVGVDEPSDLVGTLVGGVELLAVLGEGGMGTVYRGFDKQLGRHVAVKALRAGEVSDEVKERMRREARLLSQINHPSICQIYDFVETVDGPFLILELIEGQSLAELLGQKHSFSEAADLALSLFEAVLVAHREGVIHRDLKPSNVLLKADGTLKVLDFGLARPVDPDVYLMQERETPESALLDKSSRVSAQKETSGAGVTRSSLVSPEATFKTRLGATLGTALYMSPEQARGERVTTATDVYSLGLILMELLTGTRARDATGGVADLLRTVREGEVLDGPVDLDRATRKLLTRMTSFSPEARSSLADVVDQLRWLRGRSARRRTRAFMAAAVLTLVLAGLNYTLNLRTAIDAADSAKEQALLAREEAQEVSSLMEDLFEAADPGSGEGMTITARELLDRGSRMVKARFQEHPRAHARFLVSLGGLYLKLGLYTEAESLLIEAKAIREAETDSKRQLHPEVCFLLGEVYFRKGRWDEAYSLLRAAKIAQQAVAPAGAEDLARTLNSLANLHLVQGQLEEAESLYRQAVKLVEDVYGFNNLALASPLTNLAGVYRGMGRLEEALVSAGRVLAIEEEALGGDHPNVAIDLHTLGEILMAMGRLEESESHYRRALSILAVSVGPEHPDRATVQRGLASLLLASGRFDEAEELYRSVLEIRERSLGAQHPKVASALDGLARVLTSKREFRSAEALQLRGLAIREASLGSRHLEVAENLEGLAVLYSKMGLHPKAESFYLRSLEILQASPNAQPELVARVLSNLSDALLQRGLWSRAEAFLRRSIVLYEETIGPDHPRTAFPRTNLGLALWRQGRGQEAEPAFRAAAEAWLSSYGPDYRNLATPLAGLALLLLEEGRRGEARAFLEESLRIQGKSPTLDRDMVEALCSAYRELQEAGGDGLGAAARPHDVPACFADKGI